MQPADGISRPVSALSNLSVALEKLAMPPPSRPSTSMGFNRELEDDDEAPAGSSSETKAKDDNGVGRVSAPKDGDLSGPRKTATANDLSIPSGHSIANRGTSLFNRNRGVVGSSVAGQLYPAQGPRKMFGVGGGVGQRASKRSTLPTVAGSPVKGGAAPSMPEADEVSLATPVLSGLSSDQRPIAPLDFSGISMADLLKNPDESAVSEDDAHDPTNPRKGRASRRASLASHMLAQSLSGIPQTPDGTSTMGPPPSLPGRRVASDSQAPIEGAGPATAPAAIGRTRGVGAHVSVHRNTEPSGSNPLPAPSLDVLKECKIFVDVKTDEGDDAGSLFVEMLKGLGAKLTGRVGPRCTHIVYKNGLMSTLTRYRLLNDPKPFVVGIAWVVECVEQRARVDESKFEVDLEGANVAGTNKRRRSMLPKQMSYSADQPTSDEPESESDTSFIGASGGIADTSGKSDSLPPLELARRRRMTNG
ncbi:hypothetical protein PUNSTDRAFT_121822 [Punctularia strigosozonata HHB-11173 SS5]|uniref:uncharacterized protein n=1 Tax=Punctularia strigosozonata (strain HHB-11173) TaxID=741275 RepID=UPI000441676C|nr:uncharacterized protein PUNSTDRAFT_121822 [Punctularia strigosozonata HHB-11173 SS5]EIN06707.1 hypothetical protein PUNSTDRAFT_121822 [Punctularia strigosozonata HHB-11173 SS5]